jgi:hypothetical protein
LFPKILYPFHPLFGKDCEAFGSAGGERDMIYVRLADRTTRGIPAWMFDPVVCSSVRLADTPLIEAAALSRLSDLLAVHPPDARTGGHDFTRKQSVNGAAREK